MIILIVTWMKSQSSLLTVLISNMSPMSSPAACT